MAGGARLSPGAGTRLLAVSAVVLLLHVIALQWLARQLEQSAVLRQMATPMFTRLLQPQAPAAVPAPPAAQAAPARPRRPAITALASAKPAKRKASQPVPPPTPQSDAAPASAPGEPATDVPVETAGESTMQPAPEQAQVASAPEVDGAAPPATAAPSTTTAAPAAPGAEPAALDTWPVDTRLNYRLGGQYRGELHGSARVQWQREGNRYQTRVDIDLTLLTSLVLTSQGEVTMQGLLPRAYEELRRSGPRGVRFGDETITLSDGRHLPRPEGVQDTASQFVELSHRFATGLDTLEVGRSVSFWMARPGGIDRWTYDIVDREILHTPELGAVEAFHLKPRPIANPRGNITAEMWFAPSLQYLPVRIRVSMGDTYVDLIVDRIEQR
jgi:outer membrane biosynthesis protein TonB